MKIISEFNNNPEAKSQFKSENVILYVVSQ